MSLMFGHYFILFILVAFAGFVDAIAGGGGLITVPAYLAIGMPAEFVLGTNKVVSTAGTTFAVYRYIKSGTIYWRLAVFTVIASLLGAPLGARLASYLDKQMILILLLILVPVILLLQRKRRVNLDHLVDKPQLSLPLIVKATLISLIIGAYDGLFGPGTGTFLLFAFMSFLTMSPVSASANARIANYASNISAMFYFLFFGKIMWQVAAVAIIASLCGNWLGSGLMVKKAEKIIFPMFRLVLILLLCKCGYDLYALHLHIQL